MVSGSVVLDAGHGGLAPAGSSTPEGVHGLQGTREKALTLDLARRVRGALTAARRVVLTRDADVNESLGRRTEVARAAAADAFVSLHFNGSDDPMAVGAEIRVDDRADAPSRKLAARLLHALREVAGQTDAREAELAVLSPERHAPHTAACLVEAGFLTSPREEERLRDPAYRDRLAQAIAGALDAHLRDEPHVIHERRETFDLWHEVPLVYQTTGMSCWAAAAAMLVGWRDCIDMDVEEVARGAGRWEAIRDGLEPADVEVLARTWGLVLEPPRRYSLQALRELLERYGPLWIGEASPGLHVVTLAGMYGDGTPDGTFVRVADPWPIGRGERYTLSFRDLARHLEAAATIAGIEAQVIHGDGRQRGRRRETRSVSEVHATFQGR